MPESQQTYSYRAGRKIALEKRSDQYVVRTLPEELEQFGISGVEQVSSASSRVTTRADDLEVAMSRSRYLAPTHHAYYVAETGEEFLITDRVFVTFRQPLAPEDVDAFAGRYGLVKLETYSDRDYLFQLTDHTGMNPVKLVVKLTEDDPLVEVAEHDLNQRMTRYQFSLPTDPAYAREWHLHTRVSHAEFDPRASSRCEAAWQLLGHFGSPDVVVGVTDDGCKLDHPDFDSPGKFAGWGYFDGTRLIIQSDIGADPGRMYQAGANHGTSCAGVIAGEVDAVLTVGAAPGCRLLPIKWESDGSRLYISDSKLLTALDYIADKVDVLSNSWGSTPYFELSLIVTRRITDLAQRGGRRGRGIIFLWAAGNENCPIQHTATQAIPYTNGWECRSAGSCYWIGVSTSQEFLNNLVGIAGLMHIAALASNAQRSHYSNYGTGIGLCAPTNNVHEYYRITVPGLGITTATGSGSLVTDQFGGTSSATPLVAGIAALIISAFPDLTAIEVVSILKQTASKDLNVDGYPRTPPASYDPDPSWDISPVSPFDSPTFVDIGSPDGSWSPWFGHGRVDATNAVAEALRRAAAGPAQQIFRQSSAPALAIPDNDATGISDRLNFADEAMITAVKVVVDISHTYIGDLRLTLTAPSATPVVLHNRNGGSANNIKRTYDLSSTPELSGLVGQPLQGDWQLQVQDLAARDTGELNRWELEIQGQPGTLVILEEAPGTTIPDNKPAGIERKLTTTEGGSIKTIQVMVDITHSYIGDLEVTLFAPDGTAVPLHQRTGGASDNLIGSYTPATTPALQSLRGHGVEGTWRLKVAYREAADVGKLNRWAVTIGRE